MNKSQKYAQNKRKTPRNPNPQIFFWLHACQRLTEGVAYPVLTTMATWPLCSLTEHLRRKVIHDRSGFRKAVVDASDSALQRQRGGIDATAGCSGSAG